MKKSIVIAVASIAFLTGCASTGGLSKQNTQDAAIILRTAARGAATVAIAKNPDNTKYVQLSVAAMDTFLVNGNYQPGALVKSLSPMVKEVKSPEVALAINSVTDLYEVFYGRYAKNQIAQNETASLFITALRDGAQSALVGGQ